MDKIGFVILIFFLSSCVQEEETPTKLMKGYYRYNKNEGIHLLNDTILVMQLKMNNKIQFDTLSYRYVPPVISDEFVSVGNLYIESKMNQQSKLFDYCNKMNFNKEHLIYTLRFGKYMLLPNPESTDFRYELVNAF
jgi:hypothetical protein